MAKHIKFVLNQLIPLSRQNNLLGEHLFQSSSLTSSKCHFSGARLGKFCWLCHWRPLTSTPLRTLPCWVTRRPPQHFSCGHYLAFPFHRWFVFQSQKLTLRRSRPLISFVLPFATEGATALIKRHADISTNNRRSFIKFRIIPRKHGNSAARLEILRPNPNPNGFHWHYDWYDYQNQQKKREMKQ